MQCDAMRQEATAFVSNSVASAQALVEKILAGDELQCHEVDKLAVEANTLLENAELVASVTGVTYFLDYYEEYNDVNPLSSRLTESDNEHVQAYGNGPVGKLYDTLESMEGSTRDRHSSTC